MSIKKKSLIIVCACLVLLALNAAFIVLLSMPTIRIKGEKTITINLNSEYKDAGYKAEYLGQNISKDVKVEGNVDTSKAGTYTITYTVNKGLVDTKVTRTIVVKDLEPPLIELKGDTEKYLCPGATYQEEGYTASDNLDGDITTDVQIDTQTDQIVYTVFDKEKNKATAMRKLYYEDQEKPTITLTDGEMIQITKNQEYVDPGYNATDNCDGSIKASVKVSGTVDTSTLGTYKITYEVSDKAQNKTMVTRTVQVIEPVNGVVYLTFDDGPGQYTQRILDTLAKYNVKATFFVTNQFSKYQNMIAQEAEQGHTVAIHTLTHSWNIYNSVDSYLNDFNQMQEIVKNQTGSYTKYFRFPGGSSNTVSKKHATGIMTTLAQVMTEKGYIYYDWNVDSGDTHKNNTVSYIVSNIKKYVKGDGSYIILMHDIKKNTMEALPSVISYLKGRGYTFKAIDDNTPIKHFKIAN